MIDLYNNEDTPEDLGELNEKVNRLRSDFDAHNHDGSSSRSFQVLNVETLVAKSSILAAQSIAVAKDSYASSTAGIWLGLDGGVAKLNIGDGSNYLKWTGTALNILGDISGGTITIGANAWHVDSSGNMWWGSSSTYAGATIKISSAGAINFTTGTFSGALNINNKFIVDSSGNATMKSYALINQFTAGENLTAGSLGCLKNAEAGWGSVSDTPTIQYEDTTGVLSAFTYVDEDNPATASGASPALCKLGVTPGNNHYWVYGKLDLDSTPPGLPTWSQVEEVKLMMYVVGTAAAAQSSSLYYLTAAFTEASITWNNKPANSTNFSIGATVMTSEYQPADKASSGSLDAAGYIEFDITDLYRMWSAGKITNNGFVIKTNGSAGQGNATIGGRARTGGGHFNQAPFILSVILSDNPGSGTSMTANDGKVYLADYSKYRKIKNLVGIIGSAVNAEATADVYALADRSIIPTSVISTTGNIGKMYYLVGSSGNISTLTNDIINADYWNIKLGVGTSNGVMIDLEKKPLFIKLANVSADGLLPPPNANMAIIDWSATVDVAGSTYTRMGQITLRKDKIDNLTQETQAGSAASKYVTIVADWASGTTGKLTVTFTFNDCTESAKSAQVYWYR